MYLNVHGNVFCDCVIVTKPVYRDDVGEYRTEMTKCLAKSKEQTPDGLQTVNLNLLFFAAFAIPAMKISPGMCIVVAGRETAEERFSKGRNILERTLVADWWQARDIDPLGHLEELKVRRENVIREEENKKQFAHWLTMCKPTLKKWFLTEWLMDAKETILEWVKAWLKGQKKSNTKKKGDRGNDTEPGRAQDTPLGRDDDAL